MAKRGVIFKDDFISVPSKSWFDMSYDNLLSMNFGEIVPTTCMECMAEDVIHAKSSNFTRLAPLVAPAFGKVNQFSYHFYVRNRDIWTHWDSFFTSADQKKSWQSSIGSTFVPPVMPYIDVRELLYAPTSLFMKYPANVPTLQETNVGTNDNIYYFGDGYSSLDLHALLIWNDGGNDSDMHAAILENPLNVRLNTNSGHFNVILFVPNKNEVNRIANGVTHIDGSSSQPFYNPFSNGSLLDYLGVDLTGLYDQQYTWMYDTSFTIDDVLTTTIQNDFCLPYGSSFKRDKKFLPKDLDVSVNQDGTEFAHGISLDYDSFADFVKSHVIVGNYYIYNSQNYVAFGPNNGYLAKNSGTVSSGNISTDLGLSVKPLYFDDESSKINDLPLRAYYFVYSEYFRDENYVDINPIIDFTRDGNDIDFSTFTLVNIFDFLTLKVKSWEHDPYTTALPAAQRGPAVRFLANASVRLSNTPSAIAAGTYKSLRGEVTGDSTGVVYTAGAAQSNSAIPSEFTLVADLSAATIENFRFANATQRYLEKVARSGNRYYEYMKSIFGADIEDAKLNRPIYLQGDKTPIQVSEVLQTSASQLSDDQPLGQMAGRAVAVGNDDYLEYVTPDNGFFIELCCVLPRVCYQQGLNQMFTRKVQLDYPIPDYAQLGEEQVETGNLYYSADSSIDSIPFGYQSRYWSWKYNRDVCHGEFKDSLDHWTWARKFDSRPIAGKKFLEVDVDYRQFAVPSRNTEHVYTHMFHDIQVQRALPIFGVPSL